MDDAALVGIVKTLEHLYDDVKLAIKIANFPFCKMRKVGTGNILHGKIEPAVVLPAVDNLDDIGMRHFRQSCCFAIESLESGSSSLIQARVQYLDGYLAIK